MTVHRTLPSEVEPEALADLIEDCRALPAAVQPHPAMTLPRPRTGEITIPDTTVSLLDGYADYGS